MDKYLLHYSGRSVFSTGGVDYLSTYPLLLHNHSSPVFYTHNLKCLQECLDHQGIQYIFIKSTNFQYTAIQINYPVREKWLELYQIWKLFGMV